MGRWECRSYCTSWSRERRSRRGDRSSKCRNPSNKCRDRGNEEQSDEENSDEEESDGDTDEENTDEGESDENYAEDKIDGQGEQMPSWARCLMAKMNEMNERLIALELGMRMGKMRI
jgi:hypothetical protein